MFNKEDGSGITFGDAAGLAGDLTAQGITSVGKGAYDLVDMGGDGLSFMADLFTNVAADVTGNDGIRTSLSANKGLLDKGGEHIAEGKRQINEATKSKLRDTNEGQLAFDVVGTVGEFVAPAGGGVKATKKIDPKAMVESLKKIPKAMDEIKAMMSNGEKINQSKIMNIYEKYSGETNVVPDIQKLLDSNPNITIEQAELANTAMKAIDGGADFHKIEGFKELPKDLKDYVLNFSEGKGGMAKDLSAKSDRMLAKEGQMDDITGKYNAPSGDITLPDSTSDMDKIVGDFNKFLETASPEIKDSLMKKYPKLSKALIGGGGITAALGVLGAMRANEKEQLMNDITSPKVNTPDMSRSEEEPVSTPDMSRAEEEPTTPDTIDAKKKELQAMKEKNASTLNASTSIVDLMKMLGANSTMEARKILFEKLTSKPYQGTAEQNIELKALVEEAFSTGKNLELITPIKR